MNRSNESIRFGIIGCGRAARNYAVPGLSAHPNAVITAVASRTRENAVKLSESLPGNPAVFEDVSALVCSNTVDAVVICTPPTCHSQEALAALEQGKQVMVEKPAVTSEEDARALIRTAGSRGLHLCVHQPLRFLPSVWTAKLALERGEIGEITSVEAVFKHAGPKTTWPYDLAAAGLGGAFFDLGVHLVDAIRFLANDNIHTLRFEKRLYPRGITGIEEFAQVYFSTMSGIVGKMTTSWVSETIVGTIRINGERGKIILKFRPLDALEVILEKEGAQTHLELVGNPHQNPFYYFVDLILGRVPSDEMGISISSNLRGLQPVFQLYEGDSR